jgi:homopolymeric O-antigen transport system permease protein
MTSPDYSAGGTLVLTDLSTVPEEPPSDALYNHKVRFVDAVRSLWAHREIVYTLAERDFRSQYKQATLGITWALITPVLTLVIFTVVFSHVKAFGSEGIPYALFTFVGVLCWSFFSTALGNGGNALLTNKALLAKTQFPRECFTLEVMLLSAVNTVVSWIPLALLFVIFGRAPALTTLFVPIFMVVEIAFAAGIALAISSTVIQMRDLVQVLPIITSLGIFLTPVIWPYSKIPTHYHIAGGTHVPAVVVNGHVVHAAHWVGGLTVNLQVVYGFLNPLGPVIDNARRTMLLGLYPDWATVASATIGAALYLVLGYRLFKRLEVNFADIA